MKNENKFFGRLGYHFRIFPGLCLYLTFLILLQLSGCATTYPVNPPLTHIDENTAYNYKNVVEQSDRGSGILFLLAFLQHLRIGATSGLDSVKNHTRRQPISGRFCNSWIADRSLSRLWVFEIC